MNLKINQYINTNYQSNTYLIISGNDSIIIDIGSLDFIDIIYKEKLKIQGVFLTHAHTDHIYYLNEFIELFPNVKIFASLLTYYELNDSKKNLSFYQNKLIEYHGKCTYISDNERIQISQNISIEILSTPGHTNDSMSFIVNKNFFFTGDAFIPYHKVITKFRNGNKKLAGQSVHNILQICKKNSGIIIFPGHFGAYTSKDIIELY